MAVKYTAEEIQRVLDELHIHPLDGTVTSAEAARILTWRARAEYEIDHTYTVAAVRRHVHVGHLNPRRESKRFNRHHVENIFSLRLTPKRGRSLDAA